MADFAPPVAPHGPIVEVFPDVFLVTGGMRFQAGLSITRNMTILRQGEELVLVNSVRLSKEREAELEKLGKVTHVVRTGAFHGLDDPYYVERYAPTYWEPPGAQPVRVTTKPAEPLAPGSSPITGSTVFAFERGKAQEAAIVLERDGGILLACDSFQNWTDFAGCSLAGGLMMRTMGFGPSMIGKPWLDAMGTDLRADYDRLRALDFKHVVPAHGTVLRDDAKAGLERAVARSLR